MAYSDRRKRVSVEGVSRRISGTIGAAAFGLVIATGTGYATLPPDSIKQVPSGVSAESSPNLPPEVQSLEIQTAPLSLDRATTTEHTAYDDGYIVAQLEAPTTLRAIKIFGAAPYTVSVYADVSGTWQPVTGLQQLSLGALPDAWTIFKPGAAITTTRLRFHLTPLATGSGTGIKAIEIWGSGGRANVKDAQALLDKLRGTTPPSHGRLYSATPTQGVIGASAGATDDPSDNTFSVALNRSPSDFKRAYLAYEVMGVSHWISAVRSINGRAVNGFILPSTEIWSTQLEPIDPSWLVQGPNTIQFSTPAGSSGTYTVKNLYIVGELESGANFVSHVSANQPEETNPSGAVRDGDLATGWTPYPSGSVRADAPTLTFTFDKPTQLDGFAFYLANSLKGSVNVEFQQNGAWAPSGMAALDGRRFAAGWNTAAAKSTGPVDGMRLVFVGGQGSSAEIKEVLPSGSGVGPIWNPPRITATFPDAGQYYGRTAYLRGFLQPADNGSGAAQLYVADRALASNAGAFETTISKDDVGLSAQGDSEHWSIEVKAVYPDGQIASTIVSLNNYQSPVESTDGNLLPAYNVAVAPGQAKKIAYDGAALDLGADALGVETTLTVQPLREEEIAALDTGMTNVTKGPRRGYRFLPHPMKFNAKVRVTLPYNKALIPPGSTEQDIKTFYFDDQAGSWKELERLEVNATAQTVTSLTDHFTDMINATVTVPDHPQAVSFNPTQIKDIKAADPGAQVNLIEPPRVNNMGDARLAYPIEVPPGRQGMQPQIAVQYNSSGGNGWMGMGWDVPMQAITIDTRWGVPRYDGAKETETYMLSGEQLTPLAHRGDLVDRTPEKVFHTRVEGQFRKIVRHGTSPANYWWEVTDKNGTKYFYGGDATTNAPVADSTLTDAGGNVFMWSLREVRDTNGNTIKYHCVHVSDTGVVGGSVPGSNLYVQEITYTGSGAAEGPYKVRFTRDRDLSETLRVDKMIDARGGFKRVTADLLRKIDVTFSGQAIRSYEFKYNENPYGDNRPAFAFNKTLLTAIVQNDAKGIEFNRHTFTYNDEARDSGGNYHGFASSSDWGVGGENISAGLLGKGLASTLGGSKGNSVGGHFYVGVGFGDDTESKESTGGLKVGYNRSSNETLITIADMNGDGLPDKVFKSSGGFSYRPNMSGPNGANQFGPAVQLPTLTTIGKEKVTSTTIGGELYFGLPVMFDRVRATTQTTDYFTDVNGDGITDLVSGNHALFGYINAAGVPTFSSNSSVTPAPIGGGAVDTDGLLEDASAIEAERAQNFPLLDTVRRWVAPYAGVITINAPVNLIRDTSDARGLYDGADGVRVAIQLEGAELWAATIAATDYDPHVPTGVTSIPVQRGDRLYFRVQSVFDGAYDRVSWDPEITYQGVDLTRTDVNSLPVYRYRASTDFTLFGRRAQRTAPVTGTVHLGGTWEKTGVTTDEVTLVISRNGADVYRRTLGASEINAITLSQDITVTQLDVLEWRIYADSPIDATRVRFAPVAYYTAADGVDQVTDDDGKYVLQLQPPFTMDLYPSDTSTAPQDFYVAPSTGVLPVEAALQITGLANGETTNAVLTVKRRGTLLVKQAINIVGTGLPLDIVVNAAPDVVANDELFFDISSRDTNFATRVTSLGVTAGGIVVPAAIHVSAVEELFPQSYRGWAPFGYNGNPPRAGQSIDQSLVVFPRDFDPNNVRAYPFVPDAENEQWRGPDDLAWVRKIEMSSSRLGLDDIRMPRSEQFAGAAAVPRISKSTNNSVSAGITGSEGTSQNQVDFVDLNGDRFPDVVGQGGVQYSPMIGGLEAGKRDPGLGSARVTDSQTFGASTDGAGNIARAISNGAARIANNGNVTAMTADQGSDMPSIGFSANIGSGSSDAQHDLMDINGDGLPDKVYRNGTAALNLGYRFAAAEPWNSGIVNHGESFDAGGGATLGYNEDYYSWAFGLSLTVGETKSEEVFVDINGDGLVDKVILGSPLKVRLNTGVGYTGPINWPGGQNKVAIDKHISLGGGGFVTFGFTIYDIIKVVFNPGLNFSTSMGRPEYMFRDVDGDGYADHLRSERSNELNVALNPIGRTNLLKSVKRPLGARIDIEYTRDGNTYPLPQSRWLMTKVNVFDGQTGDGVDNQLTTFTYGAPHYNRLERDFYGYKNVAEQQRNVAAGNALYRSIVREFFTDNFYTKGLLKRELTTDVDARPFLETENSYVLRDVDTGITPVNGESTSATIFPQLSRTDRRFYEGLASAQKATYTTHEYDSIGNVTRFVDTGDVGAADDVEALINYTASDAACQSTYIVGMAKSIDVIGNGALMRRRTANINCATGDVEQVAQSLANGQAAVTDMTYFPNGNLASIVGPTNKNGQRYALTYQYDPAVQTHVTGISDSFGYSSAATHNYLYGKVESTTDLNNQQVTYTYDDTGRTKTIVGPYEQGKGQTTIAFDYHPEAVVPYAFTQHIDKDAGGALMPSGTIDTVLFTDGLKRVLQTKKDGAIFTSADGTPVDSMIVSGRVTFDHVGRTIDQYYPVTEPKGANTMFNPTYDTVTPTVMVYDVLDRNTRTTIPDGTSTSIAYGFGADRNGFVQFETMVTDANNIRKETYRDVRELITSVKEHNQGTTLWTSYAYDPLKQITQVIDDKSNTTTVAYDNLGRRTIIDNPDLGKTETVYDLASNVTAKITATLRNAGQQVTYDYDFNRLKSITYPAFPGNNVAYTYGAPSAPENAANRVIKVTSEGGIEERGYGPLGELVRQKWTINSDTQGTSANSPEVYTTTYLYDTWNRVMRITYPDGELLTYQYDSGGLVKNAQGVKDGYTYDYVKRLEYDKFEQRAFVEYGNNVRTSYSYRADNRRLCGLVSAKGTPSSGCRTVTATPGVEPNAFQANAYKYDNVGNILSLQNQVPVPPPSQFGGPATQNFNYDDLYRLTHADGRLNFNPDKTRTYNLDLTYDTIHNIVSKQQTDIITQPSGTPITQKKTSYIFNYAYNGSGPSSTRPHAPTHIGDRTYSYDANGNQLGWDHDQNGTRRTIVWDEENRIQSLFDNGHEKTYKYDDAGNRVIKRGPQGETAYVNQYFTMRNREVGTKHVYLGTTRSVSKLMKQDKPGANPQGKTPLEKDLYFYHPDHLGSSSYITDTNGKLYEHLEYFPFGETWVEESTNTQRTPYLFTSKELDEETGLYYFGARYYDPRTSVWQSGDPILGKYLNGAGGGLEQPINFSLYTYGRNNPIAYKDPDGNIVFLAIPLIVKGVGAAVALYGAYETGHAIGTAAYQVHTGEKTLGQAAKEGAVAVGTNAAISATGLGAAKVAKKFLPADTEKQLMERVKRLYTDRGQKTEKHHADPKFMGGDKKQDLTELPEKVHDQLHSDMNKHLREVKDAAGHDMAPRKGNPGRDIRQNFSRDELRREAANFYKENEIRYYEPARDFFKQNPDLK